MPKEPTPLGDVCAGRGAPHDIEVARKVLEWLEKRIAAPHPMMPSMKDPDSPRAICPSMWKLLKMADALQFVVHSEIDGRKHDDIVALMLEYLPFMIARRAKPYTSLIVAFPSIAKEDVEILNACQAEIKRFAVQEGLMASQFFDGCTIPSRRNPDFTDVLQCEVANITLRKMQVYDIRFLNEDPEQFKAYDKRFGDRFVNSAVLSEYEQEIADKYWAAKQRFG